MYIFLSVWTVQNYIQWDECTCRQMVKPTVKNQMISPLILSNISISPYYLYIFYTDIFASSSFWQLEVYSDLLLFMNLLVTTF